MLYYTYLLINSFLWYLSFQVSPWFEEEAEPICRCSSLFSNLRLISCELLQEQFRTMLPLHIVEVWEASRVPAFPDTCKVFTSAQLWKKKKTASAPTDRGKSDKWGVAFTPCSPLRPPPSSNSFLRHLVLLKTLEDRCLSLTPRVGQPCQSLWWADSWGLLSEPRH